MAPSGGPDPSVSFSQGFFEIAAAQNPKPKTLAIIAGDAEFPRNASDGARKNAKSAGLQIVYDKTYPPTATDYTPIVRAIDAANPDVVFSASYPPDAVGMVRAANEVGLKAKLFGRARRPPICRDQAAAWVTAQRHRQLPFLGARESFRA